ncbi:NAD-dependent epimerase/dehydratase family protein [Lentzea sp. CC55]|uniref:NAD-dependent epimerase/dehydratase family protein n=1 Tax=Lentzea sp. CC55 TaxID=2884909 RepID=UPI001F4546FA|nr:NAD-dependent epimerase/dehydratase family protein [Lentzea sp. CC55]MCG8922070.1 NAD-dependent epimerase/dehydratase family protein [Lentzea sp. CC55]
MVKVVITGASGNVGTGLVRALAADSPDHEIVGVCRRPPPAVAPYDSVTWQACDLAADDAPDVLEDVMRGADAVVHLAWMFQPVRDGARLQRTNFKGTAAVLRAARRAGVPHVVHASSIAAYGSAPASTVSEEAPTTGIAGSAYGEGKSEVEAEVARFAAENPDIAVAVVRPALVAQAGASASFLALFLDPVVPRQVFGLMRRGRLPLLPLPSPLRVQLVHADDVGDAIVRILHRRARGPFNVAADALELDDLAAAAGARAVPVPVRAVKAVVSALWRLRALHMSPGWFDVGTKSPLIDTTRAREELGWAPRKTSAECAREQIGGIADATALPSPVLRRDRFKTEPTASGSRRRVRLTSP